MPKTFDPEKYLNDARASVADATKVKQGLAERLTKASDKVTAAEKARDEAAAAKQKVVDSAVAAREAIAAKIAEQDQRIAVANGYIGRVSAEPVAQDLAPEGVPSQETLGSF